MSCQVGSGDLGGYPGTRQRPLGSITARGLAARGPEVLQLLAAGNGSDCHDGAMGNRIAFLGCGPMNEAIMCGLLKAGTSPADVVATVRRTERAAELARRYPGITAISGAEPGNNQRAADGAAVVILGVKPDGVAGLSRQISGSLSPQAIVISVAAGVSLARLEGSLPPGQPVIRAVPNIASLLGRGVVSVSPGSSCSREQLQKSPGRPQRCRHGRGRARGADRRTVGDQRFRARVCVLPRSEPSRV